MDNPQTLPILSNMDSNKITWVNPGANYILLDTINCMDNNK
jgi:hypothetical protein